jgi:hypothetical protein
MESWRFISSPTLATFTIDQIKNAAATVKAYVEVNQKLPDTITINETSVNMAQFLELLMSATLQINNGNNNPIALKSYSNPTNPIDDIYSGNILKAEYLKIANDLKNYMDSTGKTPDYQYQTSLGTHLGFENLIYMYSKILNFYGVANYLPNFAEMKPWNALGATDYGKVEKLGPFGNINSPVKIAYIVGVHPIENASHQALIESIKDNNVLLNYCYYIYKVTVTKDANNYEKGRMNGQLLANKFVVPDIINEKFNLAIDVHSNVGNWQYRRFIFSPVPGTSAESIAKTIKNEMGWLTYYVPPNPTSTQYVTVPLIQGGIPAVVFEVYTYDAYDIVKNQVNQLVLTVNNLFS